MSGGGIANPINVISKAADISKKGTTPLMGLEKKVNPLSGTISKGVGAVNSVFAPYAPRQIKPFLNPDAATGAGGANAINESIQDISGSKKYQTPDELAAERERQDESRRVEGIRQGSRRILGGRRQFGDNLAGSSDLANEGTDLPGLTPEEAALSPELQGANQQNALLSSIAGSRKSDILQRRRQPGRSATILSKGNQ